MRDGAIIAGPGNSNGSWTLPPHARGVGTPIELDRVPAGEPGLVQDANAHARLVLADPPEDGWTQEPCDCRFACDACVFEAVRYG